MAVTEIRSFKAFRVWLRKHGQRGEWFGRIGFNHRSLLVSRERVWRFAWDKWTPDTLPLYPLNLPVLSPIRVSKDWWKDIFEQRIADFFRNERMRIYCVVCVGTWRALPDWCVMRSKDEWEIIPYDVFEREVGPELLQQMCHEQQFLGFSIREVPESFNRPAARARNF